MKRLIFAAGLFLLSGKCFSGAWTDPIEVDSVFTEGTTDVLAISTSDSTQLTDGCLANRWIFVADNEQRRGRGFSILMAAIASGKKVSFWYDSDSCSSWNYHKVTSIKFIK